MSNNNSNNLLKVAAAKAVILGKDAFYIERSNSLIIKDEGSISPDRKEQKKFNVFFNILSPMHLKRITEAIELVNIHNGMRVSIAKNKKGENQVSFFGLKNAEEALTLVEKVIFRKGRALRV